MNKLDHYPDLMDIKQVAEVLSISKPFARQLCLRNQIKYIRIGWLYKVEKSDLIDFINKNKRQGV
ncbi:helix-turn-helix domain-containing protein [uncultured Fusobacterium sp.]|uniref:helix-turn-helix domain-containing protein n=1 Tax=uncultured Fusobacterium sp. TaxID=159267 RepID=UPI0025EAED9E|nr:helix-turn-helix domain-containing protein [uncultured Fusobacterium sp.]